MIDLDDALRDYATRWSADQPAAPDVDQVLKYVRASRPRKWRSRALLAACAVAAIAVATVTLALNRTARPSTLNPRPPTSGPASAAEFARLQRMAFDSSVSGGDPYASADAVRTTVRRADALLGGKDNPNLPDAAIWLVLIHGRRLADTGWMGPTAGPPAEPYLYYSVPIGGTKTGFDGTSKHGFDLSRLGTVIHLLTGSKTAAQLAHVRTVALRTAAHYGHPSTIQAVRTTDFQAGLAMGEATPPPASEANVWIIQMTGNFACTTCRGPGPEPKGRYVIAVTGGGMSGDTITNEPVDLGRLGAVITLKG